MLKSFDHLREQVKERSDLPKKVAVVQAASRHVLDSVLELSQQGFIIPLLIGDKEEITQTVAELGQEDAPHEIVEAFSDEEAAATGVRLVRENKADFLMKGHLSTGTLLKQVVNRETGIRKREVLSHLALIEVPSYPRLIGVTDGGMLLIPSLVQKEALIQNAADVMMALGYEYPKFGILSASETVQTKLPASTDASELTKKFEGEKTCLVEGPISLDIALHPSSAEEKEYRGLIQGDADVLVVPDIVTGNTLAKSMTLLAGGEMAGLILGSKVPIIVTSRSSTAAEKTYSLLLALQVSEASER